MPQLGKTKQATVTYLSLAGLQRGLSLLLLPFITHVMSPVEYGAASMLTATSLMVIGIVAAPLIQQIIRAAARGEEDGPALLRVAGTYCYFVLPIAFALGAAVFVLLVPELLGVSGLVWGIELLAIGLQPAATIFGLWVAQAREDLRRFVLLSSASILATAASKLLLVVGLHMGVLGWAISDLFSAGLSAALAISLVRLPRVQVTYNHVRSVLSFSLPLIPHTAALWSLSTLSRPAMAAVSTLDQVGLLAFGLNLASVASLVLQEINRAVLPRFARENFPAPTRETLALVRWQLTAAIVVPAVVGSGVTIAGPLIFAEAFWPSFAITGVLLIGQAAYGLYLIPMNYMTQTAGLPKYSAAASGAGAVLILVSILIAGRSYGAAGAAYATAAGYFVMAGVTMVTICVLKLDIAWSTWLDQWPEVVLSTAALICSVAALASPVGALGRAFAVGGLVLALGAVVLTARRKYA
jgi:O-antigen/teichoic acid export membrane protein